MNQSEPPPSGTGSSPTPRGLVRVGAWIGGLSLAFSGAVSGAFPLGGPGFLLGAIAGGVLGMAIGAGGMAIGQFTRQRRLLSVAFFCTVLFGPLGAAMGNLIYLLDRVGHLQAASSHGADALLAALVGGFFGVLSILPELVICVWADDDDD